MKILKHGKVNRVITCNCGCEFEFDVADIIYTGRFVCNEEVREVKCPWCGKKHIVNFA